MTKDRRRELARLYRERKRTQGIFAVRCTATGETWTGATRNPDTQMNSVWFTLRLGNHPNTGLQKAWNAHGESSFNYEIVEDVADENPLLIASLLKERELHWRRELGAQPIVG